ncbi:MAG: hypothetical protein OSA99_20345 [Acidimicrobiales bacterium]|nr:hypothetical protein [Acidimicrobiales bacterium]
MTTDPLETIRDQLTHGIAGERARTARRRRIASAALVVVLVAGAGLAFASPWSDDSDDAVVASEGPRSSTTEPERPDRPGTVGSEPIWSIAQPSGWERAGRELMPNLGWDSLTMATVPLRQGGELCAQVPEQALRDMGPYDALLSIFFTGSATSDTEPWPTDFGPGDLETLENSDFAECLERSDLEIHWGQRARSGQSFYLLVAFGSDAPAAVRAQAWDTLDSFEPLDRSAETATPECVVTLPPRDQPTLPTTGPSQNPPTAQGWMGTPDLWTALPYSGVHAPRKSVWWSDHFPGGAEEEQPELAVTWTRLDKDRPDISAASPGTNAHTADEGWFMINGIDPREPGCWRVTATYKGNPLSYVYWNPPTLWAPSNIVESSGGEGALIEGEVEFDETNNCFLIDTGSSRLPVVWPGGTTVQADGPIVSLPDGQTVEMGSRVTGGGGYSPSSAVEYPIPPECQSDFDEIAVFNPGPPYPEVSE